MTRTIPAALLVVMACAVAACGRTDNATVGANGQEARDAAATTGGPGIGVTDGALRVSSNPAAPSAAYLTLTGQGRPMTLTGVTSPDAERIELHESRSSGGLVTMAPVDEISVPAGGTVAMRPGGLHLMLFGLTEQARTSGSVPLTLQFADGSTVTTVATTANLEALQAAAGAAPHGDHAGH